MLVRVVNGMIATLAILSFGQCQTPPPPPPVSSPPQVVSPTVVTVTVSTVVRGRPIQPRPIPVQTLPPTTTTTTAPVSGVFPAPAWSSWPSWRVTAQGVPFYRGHRACTLEQATVIAGAFAGKGASIDTQRWAVYVASRESGCDHTAVNIGRTDNSHGTHQLNAKGNGPLSSAGVLGLLGWTPAKVTASLQSSAAAAADLWARCGKGPWIAGDYSCRRPTS